jgi:hypothetical protein
LDVVWEWSEIRAGWPGVSDLAYDPSTIVEAFNRRQSVFGARLPAHLVSQSGTYAPLSIICDGRLLTALDAVERVGHFESRLRRHDQAAWAELEALFLLRSSEVETEAEVEPPASVDDRSTAPDWRVRRRGDDAWTYVEVARPNQSAASSTVGEYLRPFATDPHPGEAIGVTLHMRRRPSADDLELLRVAVENVRANHRSATVELPYDLGTLAVEIEPATQQRGGVAIKWIVPDDRGGDQLAREAGQLPRGASTIVMLDVSSTLAEWSASLAADFTDGKRPWVSAACLFTSGFAPSPRGESWTISAQLVENPKADQPLPIWIRAALERFVPNGVDGP